MDKWLVSNFKGRCRRRRQEAAEHATFTFTLFFYFPFFITFLLFIFSLFLNYFLFFFFTSFPLFFPWHFSLYYFPFFLFLYNLSIFIFSLVSPFLSSHFLHILYVVPFLLVFFFFNRFPEYLFVAVPPLRFY